MTDNRYIKQLDPIQGLVDYVLDVKPYHTKIVDVMIEYVYNDDTTAVIKEDLNFAWGPTKFEACVISGELVVPCNMVEGDAIQVGDTIVINYEDGSPVEISQVSEEVTGVTYNGDYTILEFGSSPPISVPTTTTDVLVLDDVTGYFSFEIISLDEYTQTIIVNGPATAEIFNGQRIRVTGTTSNDGNYTIEGSPTFNGLHTNLPVAESLTSETIIVGSPTAIVSPVRWYIPCGTTPCGTMAISFMAIGFDDYSGGSFGPTGILLESNSPLSYTLTQPIETGGPDALRSYNYWGHSGNCGIVYIPSKTRWVVSGLDNLDYDHICYTDNNQDWTTIPSLRDDTYGTMWSIIQSPDNPEELLIPASGTGSTLRTTETGLYLESSDGADTLEWASPPKDSFGYHGMLEAQRGGDVIALTPDPENFVTFSLPTSGYTRATMSMADAYGDTWFPSATWYDSSWGVTRGAAFNSFYTPGMITNGKGEWITILHPEGWIGPWVFYSSNDGYSWENLGEIANSNLSWNGVYPRLRYWNQTIIGIGADNGLFDVSVDNGHTWHIYDSWTDFTINVNGLPGMANIFDAAYDDVNDKYLLAGRFVPNDFSGDVGVVLVVSDLTDIPNNIDQIVAIPEVEVVGSVKSNRVNTYESPIPEAFTNLADDVLRVTFDTGAFVDYSPLNASWTAEGFYPPVVFDKYDGSLNSAPKNGHHAGRIRGSDVTNYWQNGSFTSPFSNMEIRAMIAVRFNRMFAGGANGQLVRSQDNGATWSSATSNFGASNINGITYLHRSAHPLHFSNDGAWIIVGDDGKISRGINQSGFPSSFTLVGDSTFGTSNINAVTAFWRSGFQNRTLAVGDDGKMAVSINNSGETWTAVLAPPFNDVNLHCAHFNLSSRWIVGGENGQMAYATASETLSHFTEWDIVNDSSFGTTTIRGIVGDVRGVWIAVGDEGKMARSIDNGKSWVQIPSLFGTSTIWHVNTDYRGTFIATGAEGKAVISRDHGETWDILDVSETFDSTDNIRATTTQSSEENMRDPHDRVYVTPMIWMMGGGTSSKILRSDADVSPQVSYWASPSSTDYHFAENESFTVQFWASSVFPQGKRYPDEDRQLILGAGSTSPTMQAGWWGICTHEDPNYYRECPIIFQVFNGTGYDTIGLGASSWTHPAIATEAFHHIAVVREGGVETRLYINGVLIGSSSDATFQRALDAYDQIFIGSCVRDAGTDNANWDGGIMDIRITKGVALYSGAVFTPPGKMVSS